MRTKVRSILTLLEIIFLIIFLTSSCSLFKKPALEKENPEISENQEKSQPANQPLEIKTPISALPEAEQAMASGAYSHALEVYQSFLEKNPAEDKIKSDYFEALERVKREADTLKKKEKYVSALYYYRLLLQHSQQLGQEARNLSFRQSDLQSEIKECQVKNQKAEAEKAFKAGHYEAAINSLMSGLKEYPEEELIKSYLIQVIETIFSQASLALTHKDWTTAGQLYSILKTFGLNHKNYLANFPLSLEEIDKSIKNCSQQLTNLGLRQYREGNLKEAIAIWEKILLFQPENEEIKKAIQTAKAQLEKIKK